MNQLAQLTIVAIPLSHPEIVDFLLASGEPKGTPVHVLGQRPTAAAEAAWVKQVQATPSPTVADLLAIDDPHHHLVQTWTGRLVPAQFLREPAFLTRNLGGWAPVYFGVLGVPGALPGDGPHAGWPDDPLLKHAEILVDYGKHIRAFGADPEQVSRRLEQEAGCDEPSLAAALARLHRTRTELQGQRTRYIERLSQEIATKENLAGNGNPPIPDLLLLDELMGQMVRLELARRRAVASGSDAEAEAIAAWQQAHEEEAGLKLILKGEYIMGRHRRSTILIAPELGVVVKQPAPEPFHEIELGARTDGSRAENWPRLTHDRSLVTPRGRLRLIVEEDVVPGLNRALGHEVRFSTLLGLTVEAFVEGKTVQERVLQDRGRLTPRLYEQFVLHQQVCEALGAENGDWHAANSVVRESDGKIVHIDWGAARPLRREERTPAGELARINQVQNIAYSFHDEELARRTLSLHASLMADEERLARIRKRAQELIGR